MAVAAGPPFFTVAAARSSFFSKHTVKEKERGGIGNVLQVIRNDRDFLSERLRPLSKSLDDFFWLRHLEDRRAQNAPCRPAAWPRISHPPAIGQEMREKDLIGEVKSCIKQDSKSLARAFISKGAISFRRYMSAALTDIFFQRMTKAITVNEEEIGQHSQHVMLEGEKTERNLRSSSAVSLSLLQAVIADRRLKVIFYKILNDVRQDSILMLRVCWSSSKVIVTVAALVLYRFLVYWFNAYVKSLVPKRIAVSIS